MDIGLFREPYTVRKHEPQKVVGGYAQAPFSDCVMQLDVQPQAPDGYQGLPEGERTVKHLKAYGPSRLTSADEHAGVPGDLLHYQGVWYECKSSVSWGHAILAHYQSDFVALPADRQSKPPEAPP